jgi:hypothetical protein
MGCGLWRFSAETSDGWGGLCAVSAIIQTGWPDRYVLLHDIKIAEF